MWQKEVLMMVGVISGLIKIAISANISDVAGNASLYPIAYPFGYKSSNNTLNSNTTLELATESLESWPVNTDTSDSESTEQGTNMNHTLVESSSEDQGNNEAKEFFSGRLYTVNQTETLSNASFVNSSALVNHIAALPAYPGKNDTISLIYTQEANISSITNASEGINPIAVPANLTKRLMLRGSP